MSTKNQNKNIFLFQIKSLEYSQYVLFWVF